jgi:hypothetical protein
MKMKYLVPVLLFLVLAASCTQNIKVNVGAGESIKVLIQENQKSYGPYMVLVSSKEYQMLQEWLNNNKTGWSQTSLVPFDSMLAPIEILSNSFVMKIWDEGKTGSENNSF